MLTKENHRSIRTWYPFDQKCIAHTLAPQAEVCVWTTAHMSETSRKTILSILPSWLLDSKVVSLPARRPLRCCNSSKRWKGNRVKKRFRIEQWVTAPSNASSNIAEVTKLHNAIIMLFESSFLYCFTHTYCRLILFVLLV